MFSPVHKYSCFKSLEFIMMLTELMPTSLCKEQDKSPMTRPQIITIARDVASALNCLHLWKPDPILHRDVNTHHLPFSTTVQREKEVLLSVATCI